MNKDHIYSALHSSFKQVCEGKKHSMNRTPRCKLSVEMQKHSIPSTNSHLTAGAGRYGIGMRDLVQLRALPMKQLSFELCPIQLIKPPFHSHLRTLHYLLGIKGSEKKIFLGACALFLNDLKAPSLAWLAPVLVLFSFNIVHFLLTRCIVSLRSVAARSLIAAHLQAFPSLSSPQRAPPSCITFIVQILCHLSILSSSLTEKTEWTKNRADFSLNAPAYFNKLFEPAFPPHNIHKPLTYRNLTPKMARSEDCLHCADLQAELEEIRTQQTVLDEKNRLLESRLEEQNRRLEE